MNRMKACRQHGITTIAGLEVFSSRTCAWAVRRVRDSSGKPAAPHVMMDVAAGIAGEDLQRIARPAGARPNNSISVVWFDS
jgi:hypothetical protein